MKFLYAAATLSLATTVVFSGNGPESDETEKCDYLCQLEQGLGNSEIVKQMGEMLNPEKLGEQLKEMQQQWEEEVEQMKQMQEACTDDEGKVDRVCVLDKELERAGVTDEEEISEIKQMQQQMQEEMKKMKQISDEIVKECTDDKTGEVDAECAMDEGLKLSGLSKEEQEQTKQSLGNWNKLIKDMSKDINEKCVDKETGNVDLDCAINVGLFRLNVEDASDRITVIDDEEITEGQTGRLLDQDSQ